MKSQQTSDEEFMTLALDAARAAYERGEVPVGAVIAQEDEVIATSANSKESTNDPLGHAEIRVIQQASAKLGRWRLTGCTLYTTLEPCVMCAGAIVHSRLDRIVYGARDPKAGAVESLYQILSDSRLNHRPEVVSGVCADECGRILSEFFAARRRKTDRQLK